MRAARPAASWRAAAALAAGLVAALLVARTGMQLCASQAQLAAAGASTVTDTAVSQQQTKQQQGLADAGSESRGASAAAGIRLYVGVLSASGHRAARDAVRAGWGFHPGVYRLRFAVARPKSDEAFEQVQAEAVEKRDLVVLGGVREQYTNLAHQTLQLYVVAAADPQVTHVLKVDDDSYVHVDRLLAHLQTLPRERLFLGRISFSTAPMRQPGGKWSVSKQEWPGTSYPPWAAGCGYLLTSDLVALLASGAAYSASIEGRLFKLEDVATGIWLDYAAERHRVEVRYQTDDRFGPRGCSDEDLVSHNWEPEQLRCLWKTGGDCSCGAG